MSLKSFHIVFVIVTISLFTFLFGFYGYLFFNTDEYKYVIISGINLILCMIGIYYCKNFIEKYKSISNL